MNGRIYRALIGESLMNTRDDRQRDITGYLIPAEELVPIVRRILAAQFDCSVEDMANVTVSMDVMLISRSDEYNQSEYAAINTEGVGSGRLPNTNTVIIWAESGLTYLDVPIGIPALLKMTRQSRIENLADHIRVFGDRLERNFNLWRRWALNER